MLDFTGNAALVVDFTGGQNAIRDGGSTPWTVSGFERMILRGTAGADVVRAGDQADVIDVRAGANSVAAGGGNDTVSYETASYDPTIPNTLDGGAGQDRLVVSLLGGGTLDAVAGTDGEGSRLGGFETFDVSTGNQGGSTVTLGAGADRFVGFAASHDGDGPGGDDLVRGGAGQDGLFGGEGRDRLYGDADKDALTGGREADLLYGGDGKDSIEGSDGTDSLFGGAGSDRLQGGDSQDVLTGGADADTFVLVLSEDRHADRITDFAHGNDRIGIAFDVPGWSGGAMPAALLREGAPQGTGGQFVLIDEGNRDRLVWDANGTGSGGQTTLATLDGESGLAASDFLLL